MHRLHPPLAKQPFAFAAIRKRCPHDRAGDHRELAEKRIFPAIDVAPSSRRDDLLMPAEEHQISARLRRVLTELDPQQAIELLLDKARNTGSNAEFLNQIQRNA